MFVKKRCYAGGSVCDIITSKQVKIFEEVYGSMDRNTILLLIPILLIQLILMVINFVNLSKKKETKYLNKPIWVVIILLFSYIGNIGYILIEGGRDDSDQD